MFKKEKGQAVLVLILIMVIALTIGLSVASRLTTDIKISTQIEESQRAFSAAEAGIEYALSANLSAGQSEQKTIGNTSYAVRVSQIGGSSSPILFPASLESDEAYQIWFVNPEDLNTEVYNSNSIRILWGNPDPNWAAAENINKTPAIQVIIVYKDGSLYKFGKFALDPRTDRGNNFCYPTGANCSGVSNFKTDGSEEIEGQKAQFSADLDLSRFRGASKILQLLRFKLLYSTTPQLAGIKPLGNGVLPVQGKEIKSTGVSGKMTREVKVFEFNPSLPAIFDFSLFSAGSIEK